ncbi:lysM and putative peptidoglycan-binding domain-containing protein 2 [Chelonus insularis]|uniref:lysM and putative peptidoglycan-binding domain-containing protein 2 n=1 Tax=Chelonus insularis TaxID=460826 RepID=UPI0015882E6B|nr:lysM and putative peptidoglycan-binding domain-containing protein 2 [Chelonus insularis]
MDQSTYREMEERRSIRDISKNLKKYGSTSKHVIRNDNLIKHFVSKTDTLPGIALKYGTTTEQIRRINRLWASDSLFLREYLLVPVINNSTATTSQQNNETDNSVEANTCSDPSASAMSLSMNDDGSIDNFLARMDSSIATVKKDIQKTQGNSAFCRDDDIFVQRRPKDRLRHSHPQSSPLFSSLSSHTGPVKSSSEDDVHDLPSAVVMTHGKKLKTSLQKLQQQQDEIFQL